MGHHWNPVLPGGIGGPSAIWPLLILLGLVGLAVVGLVIAGLVHRRRTAHWSEMEREVRENMDGQIRSMLYQTGGPLMQDRIRDSLGVSAEELAATLLKMEKSGEIRREWLPLEYTYRIHLTQEAETDITLRGGDPSLAPGF